MPGPSVFPSREPGVSGDFWGSQEGCQRLPCPSQLGLWEVRPWAVWGRSARLGKNLEIFTLKTMNLEDSWSSGLWVKHGEDI